MNDELKIKVDVFVSLSRLTGGAVILIGSLLFYSFLQSVLDANAVIEIGGVLTNNKVDKVIALVLASLFPLAGLFLVFVPRKYLDKWAVKIMSRLGSI